MDKQYLRNRIIEIIVVACYAEPDTADIRDELPFKDLGLDSLDMVLIIMSLEDEFKLVFDNREYSNEMTLGELVDLVLRKMSL